MWLLARVLLLSGGHSDAHDASTHAALCRWREGSERDASDLSYKEAQRAVAQSQQRRVMGEITRFHNFLRGGHIGRLRTSRPVMEKYA